MSRTHHTWLHLPESLIFLAMTSLPVLTSSSSFPPLSSSFVIPRHLYTEHVFVFLCYQHITVPFILQVVFEHLFLCIFYIIKRFSRKLDFPMTQKNTCALSLDRGADVKILRGTTLLHASCMHSAENFHSTSCNGGHRLTYWDHAFMDTSTPVILSDCYSKASSRPFRCHLTPADGSLDASDLRLFLFIVFLMKSPINLS